jgi:hypothetical protein
MPIQLSRGDRKILVIAAVFFAVLVAGTVLFTSTESSKEAIPSSYSFDSSGAKAAFLLLQETGRHPERWERSLVEMAPGKNKTLILAEPSQMANERERAALHKFIREGGRLIAIGQSAALMLPITSPIASSIEEHIWEKYSALAPSSITREAPQITMASGASWISRSSVLPLYGDGRQSVVITYPYGEGMVIWWAAATPLTNAGLKEPGNLEFFLACLGEKNHIYWDEYFHGYGHSRINTLAGRLALVILAQLVLLCAVVLWTFARRSGPVRPSASEVRLTPLEFVETLGGLYERAHASTVAVDICYQRFLYWLTKRLGMSPTASIEEFQQAVADRWNFYDEKFVPTLKECASARYHNLPAKRALQLVRSLHSYTTKLNLFSATAKEANRWKPSGN